MHPRALFVSLGLGLALLLASAAPASTGSGLSSHGQLIQVRANTNQSSNWFGYDQGTLEQGSTLFNAITGDWTVPTATQHTAGEDESSSDWIGIGGGCVDAACTVTDNTLIQTGTEQDVSGGQASYSAWWELVPAPSITIAMTVKPGDHMHASIAETVSDANVWTITLQDVTENETFSQTVPYASSHLTAEWIEETPLIIGTNAGLAALPNLTSPAFDLATVNGQPANLVASEEMQLIDSNGNVIGSPSAPDSDSDGFNACTWATTCAAPTTSSTVATSGSGSSADKPACVVPHLRRLTVKKARTALLRSACRLGRVVRRPAKLRKGLVLSSQPRAGSRLAHGHVVRLVVSSGKRR